MVKVLETVNHGADKHDPGYKVWNLHHVYIVLNFYVVCLYGFIWFGIICLLDFPRNKAFERELNIRPKARVCHKYSMSTETISKLFEFPLALS